MKVSKGSNGAISNESVQMIEIDTYKGLNSITTLKNASKILNVTKKKNLIVEKNLVPV